MSFFIIRPLSPVPVTASRFIPLSSAILLARGEANTRPLLDVLATGADALGVEDAAGALGGAAAGVGAAALAGSASAAGASLSKS